MPLGFANKYGVALYPFIFLLLEQVRGSFPFGGFGWMRIAYSQADAPYSSIAAIGGAVGLSALVLCISLTLFALLNARLHVFPLLPLIRKAKGHKENGLSYRKNRPRNCTYKSTCPVQCYRVKDKGE